MPLFGNQRDATHLMVGQSMTGTSFPEKTVVDSGYAVVLVHYRPQINHEARINHTKPELIELEVELEWLKKPMTQLGSRSQSWRRPGSGSGSSSGP